MSALVTLGLGGNVAQNVLLGFGQGSDLPATGTWTPIGSVTTSWINRDPDDESIWTSVTLVSTTWANS